MHDDDCFYDFKNKWSSTLTVESIYSYPARFEVLVLLSPLLFGSALLTSKRYYFVWIHLSRLPDLKHLIGERLHCLFSEKETSVRF